MHCSASASLPAALAFLWNPLSLLTWSHAPIYPLLRLAQQTQCWNPADCKCTGGTPGQRVMLFIDGTLLDAPCSAANKMGTQPKCQVGARAGCHKQ